MTVNDLIREINNCTSYIAKSDIGNTTIAIYAADNCLTSFDSQVRYWDYIYFNYRYLDECGRDSGCYQAGNFLALLLLINDYLYTPLPQRGLSL
jgi:hypothetical protein